MALGQLQCADAQGLSLARQFAMLSYRTPEEFDAHVKREIAKWGKVIKAAGIQPQ